jgi:hypothetical protein
VATGREVCVCARAPCNPCPRSPGVALGPAAGETRRGTKPIREPFRPRVRPQASVMGVSGSSWPVPRPLGQMVADAAQRPRRQWLTASDQLAKPAWPTGRPGRSPGGRNPVTVRGRATRPGLPGARAWQTSPFAAAQEEARQRVGSPEGVCQGGPTVADLADQAGRSPRGARRGNGRPGPRGIGPGGRARHTHHPTIRDGQLFSDRPGCWGGTGSEGGWAEEVFGRVAPCAGGYRPGPASRPLRGRSLKGRAT